MRKKLAAAAVTLIILAATYGFLFQTILSHERKAPVAAGGLLDLSGWSFGEDGVVPLDGEWEFYPGQLVDHNQVQSASGGRGALPSSLINVPGSWASQMDTLGMATYRLQIRIDDASRIYGIKTLSIQMSNRIIVNGVVVGSSGTPAGKQLYEASNKPYVSYFTLQPGWNELVVQVANYNFQASSGIMNSIFFGDSSHISGLRDNAIAHDLVSICCFLIMGLYFIGLYSQRKRDYSLLAFGLLCVFIAMFLSTRGERLLLFLFNSIPYWLYIRIQIVSVYAGGMALLLYVYTAFRAFCSKRFIYAGIVWGLIMIVCGLEFAETAYKQTLLMVTTAYGTYPFLYAMYVFVLAAFHRAEGSLYLVAAAVALNHYVMVQNLNIYSNLPLHSVVPFEVFLFLLMLALMMSLRFSNAFKKIEQLSVQLLNADKLKDDFLSRTSHEFKTPLAGVITISQSMIEDRRHPLPKEQQEKMELVVSISKKLSQLVLDILDLSKLKQGDMTVRPVPVDVRSTVDIVLRIFSFMTMGKNVRLINNVPVNLPKIWADENRFRQILNNLIDNAVKYTEYGTIEVSARAAGARIEIAVKDTGKGIARHDLERIFEPFQTFEDSAGQSFGLGLSIVKQLVELQNGTITVSSAEGEGTVFTFSLPSSGEEGGAGTNTPVYDEEKQDPDYSFDTPFYAENGGKHTILIADDHFSNLKILIDELKPLGCNVIAVKNGFEAVEQINRPNAVDLVILDLMMPGMTGYEVCQEIRKNYSLLEMPVLMLTTAVQPQDKLAAFEAGANDFLPKPFDTMELKARIKGLLLMKDSLEKAIELEVAFLQSQIKPHFLYNVLNTIVALSYTDEEKSRKLTTDLADYLRGSFRFSNVQKRTTFAQELNLIRSYVEIERARFKDRLRIEYDIADAMHGVMIPPLLLQPLVENAIRHGIRGRTEGGTVKITAAPAVGCYIFQIEDDGVGIEPERLEQLLGRKTGGPQGVGLKNIMKRLKYEYNSELKLESTPGGGTVVTVSIPAEAERARLMQTV
ncbi:ATP-binding protein [Paenibacillus hamazuiensis]|uniref:hybrid sensor histidine kinase/response regulator n=1 Tax=Paenibacillus hamazuiensis TaxID=2936508 RepID=UPI00200C620F|nr:ATP-binding protein [Paenibacillus hamazuiensis]